MFETENGSAEFGPRRGRRGRRRTRWAGRGGYRYDGDDDAEGGWAGEADYEAEGGWAGEADYEAEGSWTGEADYEGYGPYGGSSSSWAGEAAYGDAEGDYGGYGHPGWAGEGGFEGYGEAESEAAYGAYGEAELYGRYGDAEASWAGEAGYDGYGETEAEWAGETPYGGGGEAEADRYGLYSEAESGWSGEGDSNWETDEGEEHFLPALLPLLPIVGQVLGSVLGGSRKEAEYGGYELGDYGEIGEEGEDGELEAEFLHRLLKGILGNEAQQAGSPMSPAQEAELVDRLLEVSGEDEVDEILSRIVNSVGRAVQGVAKAASTPQGRAVVDALTPVVRAVLSVPSDAPGPAVAPGTGGPGGTVAAEVFELDSMGEGEDAEQFEAAQRVVRLASEAATAAALAPAGAPAELVGELAVIKAARRVAPPLFRRTARALSPIATRVLGRALGIRRPRAVRRPGPVRYGPVRYGRPRYVPPRYVSGRYIRRPPRAYWSGYRPYVRPWSPGYVPPIEPEPEPEPMAPPARPGYRWVAVPIGAPLPPLPPPPPPPEPPIDAQGAAPPPEGAPGVQSEYGYRGRRRYGGSGRGSAGSPSGRWIRRAGKIILLDV